MKLSVAELADQGGITWIFHLLQRQGQGLRGSLPSYTTFGHLNAPTSHPEISIHIAASSIYGS